MSKSWMKKKEEQPSVPIGTVPLGTEEKKHAWEHCGYLTISKSGEVLSVVVKKKRYVVNLEETEEVLEGRRNYTLIYEYVGEKVGLSEQA